MKLNSTIFKLAAVTSVTAAIVAGCSTPTVPISMDVAGEVKLTGVNKIAIADFNSLPGDPFTGVMSADEETCALVRRAVAASFYASPMYQIADFDIENDLFQAQESRAQKRYDAIVYGRLWWNITPVTKGHYPKKYTLEKWDNVPYTVKNPLTGKEEKLVAHVTSERKDVVQMLDYHAQNATLMLTLSVYRIDGSGKLDKIVDTYQVTNDGFTLMNGEMKLDSCSVGIVDDNAVTRLQNTGKTEKGSTAYEDMFDQKPLSLSDAGAAIGNAATALVSGFGAGLLGSTGVVGPGKEEEVKAPVNKRKVDANGKVLLTQKTVAMPTELQAKLMLASSISKNLSAKLAPSKATFDVSADLGDDRLVNLLKNGAFRSAKEYSLYMLRQKMGKQICEKLSEYLSDFSDECTYPVPDSVAIVRDYDEALITRLLEGNFDLYFYTLGTAHAAAMALEGEATYKDKMIEYLAGEDLDIYFYALGVCNEATQDLVKADDYYRFAFNVKPSSDSALGLARVAMALGERKRVKETAKAKSKK